MVARLSLMFCCVCSFCVFYRPGSKQCFRPPSSHRLLPGQPFKFVSQAGWQIEKSRLCFLGLHKKLKQLPAVAGVAAKGVPMDYSGIAKELFNNMRMPASFLAGAMVPMGFAAAPTISKEDSLMMKHAKSFHYIMATVTISCELLTVMWSTVAVNKLTESTVDSAPSVIHLLNRDYELEWIGCNVNFMIGLLGFASCLVSKAFISFGPAKKFISCFVAASVCLMLNIINVGVAQGNGSDFQFGNNFGDLVKRYIVLLFAHAVNKPGIFSISSVLLYCVSAAFALKRLLRNYDQDLQDFAG